MAFDPGDSLSGFKNIEFLKGESADDLRDQLASIKLPFKLIGIYPVGAAHYAWIVPTRPIRKVPKSQTQGG